jgi:general secretion pathway protein G
MKNNKTRKSFMTLIEIMIVMFLITIIAGVVSYKVKDSMEYGKAFKTHQNIKQVQQILEMEVSKRPKDYQKIEQEWTTYLEKSPLAGNARSLQTDGWGDKYQVKIQTSNNRFVINVFSNSYNEYRKSHSTLFAEDDEDDEDDNL